MDPQFKLTYLGAFLLVLIALGVSFYLALQDPLTETQKTLFTTTTNAFWAGVGFLLGGYAGQRSKAE